MTFYRDTFSIHVDNPGYGELYLAADGISDPYSDRPAFGCTLAGDQLGRLLTAFTHYALTGSRPTTDTDLIPPNATPEEARGSLPVVQEAVIIAAAGTDRYERLFPERDAPPPELMCALCSHGTDYSDHETQSDYCDRHGHTPFGYPAGTTWDQALQRRVWRVQDHEWKQRMTELYPETRP